jgi:hypothetical protein
VVCSKITGQAADYALINLMVAEVVGLSGVAALQAGAQQATGKRGTKAWRICLSGGHGH